MQVYAVVLGDSPEDDNDTVRDLISEHFPENYEFCDNVYLIRTQNTNVEAISRRIGILEDDDHEGIIGVVFRLTPHYSGYADMAMWEWLDDAHEARK